MSMLTQLRKEKMEALKNKDSIKNGVVSLLVSAIGLAEKERHEELSDEECLKLIQKELKQTQDALAQTPENRPELIDETNKKIAILKAYLPQQMSLEEVKAVIKLVLKENNLEASVKNKGIVIKEVMARCAGKTDGKTVNQAVSEICK